MESGERSHLANGVLRVEPYATSTVLAGSGQQPGGPEGPSLNGGAARPGSPASVRGEHCGAVKTPAPECGSGAGEYRGWATALGSAHARGKLSDKPFNQVLALHQQVAESMLFGPRDFPPQVG